MKIPIRQIITCLAETLIQKFKNLGNLWLDDILTDYIVHLKSSYKSVGPFRGMNHKIEKQQNQSEFVVTHHRRDDPDSEKVSAEEKKKEKEHQRNSRQDLNTSNYILFISMNNSSPNISSQV